MLLESKNWAAQFKFFAFILSFFVSIRKKEEFKKSGCTVLYSERIEFENSSCGRGGMKNGNPSTPNAGGNSLAIAERQNPAPSCVATLFQALAKKKLFSSSSKNSKLLPPVRAQKFSLGRPPGGGEKTLVAKTRPLLLDSVDYPRSKSEGHGTSRLPPSGQEDNCSEMCTPGVVARLMGLSSMPAVSHQRLTKAMDSSELGGHRSDCSQGLPGTCGSIGTSHQKQQKPGQLIDERHDNASQFNTDAQALWPRRHPHKVASPLKSPRSISSRNKARLIEAAAKVLEPGLQSRNRHLVQRHSHLEYLCNGDGVTSAAAVSQNLPGQVSRDMCNADVPRSGFRSVGATSLNNSTCNQWSEENASIRRPNRNVPCQVQPEGNSKGLLVSSSEKARFKDSAQRASDAIAHTNQGVQKIQPRNISRENVACSPLKQNNLKQNALPVACRAADPGHMVQGQKYRTGEQNVTNTAKDFVYSNKSMNNSTSLRSKTKVMARFGVSHSSGDNKNLSTKGYRTSGLQSGSSNKLKLKTATPKAMEKDMIIAKGAGLVSEKRKSASPNCAGNDLRRHVESRNASKCNNSGIVSFTFSSPMKVFSTSLPSDNTKGAVSAVLGSPTGTCPKRHSRRDCQNISSQSELVFREVLQGTSSLEAEESVSYNRDELKSREIPGGRVTSSLFEKMSAFRVIEKSSSDELLWQCNFADSLIYGFGELPNPVESRETHKKHEANAKYSNQASNPSRSIPRGNNHLSPVPVSILQSTYADDDCISGSPHCNAEIEFEDSRPLKACAPPSSMQDVTTERNSRRANPNFGQHGVHPSEPAVQNSKLIHPEEVTSTVELLLTNVCWSRRRQSKAPFKAFLLQTIESVLTTFTTSAKSNNTIKATEANPLGDLAFDFVMECLGSMCIQLCDSGYRSFSKLALICTEERLAAEVKKGIARCSDMAGKALDDLAMSDVEHAVETGISSSHEALHISVQIERDLLKELVDEIGLDKLRRL